jgi:tetratricopeptide (TPR) repeat protein
VFLTWLFTALLLLSAATRAAGAEDLWETANQAYQASRFEEAKSNYLQLVNAQAYSPSVFYNLGNTWWKLGQKGRAILNYRRALVLAPTATDAEANLRFALRQTGQDPPSQWSEFLVRHADLLPGLASVGLWTSIFGTLIWLHTRGGLRRIARAGALVGAAGLLLGLGLTLWIGRGDKDPREAIVLPGSVDLKVGPARSARIAETVGEGQQVAILQARGEWIQCRSQTGVVGWVPNSSVERIVP